VFRKFLLSIMLFSILLGSLSCTHTQIVKYDCQKFENWSIPECNPPLCLESRICTYDLYPKQYWDNINIQIFPIGYRTLLVQDWIIKGNVEGLTLQQYMVAQNLRYIKALQKNDKELINKLLEDADRVGYYLIPSIYIGGVKNDK